MNDTCNPARCTAKLVEQAVAAAVQERAGATKWASLSTDERAAQTKMYMGECWQHMRNIVLDKMTVEASAHLQEELEESLKTFSSYERMSTDGMANVRAVYKEVRVSPICSICCCRAHGAGFAVRRNSSRTGQCTRWFLTRSRRSSMRSPWTGIA